MRGFEPLQVCLKLAAAIVATLIGGVAPVTAQLQLPAPVGYVNDFAGVVGEAEKAQMERIMDEVRAKSGGEIVVVTLPSLEGRNRDEVALQIGREWQIGRKGDAGDPTRNTGVVILVAPTERDYRIETGTGTSSFITAGEAGRIGRDYMVPHFQQGDFGTGLLMAVTAIAQEYSEQFNFEITGEVPTLPEPGGGGGGSGSRMNTIIVIAIIIFFILSNMRGGGGRGGRGGRGRRGGGMPVIIPFPIGGGGWGRGGFGGFGGGGGGGFGGFGGGGGFSGGGAGGSW